MLEEKYAPTQPPRVESIKVGGVDHGWSTHLGPSSHTTPGMIWEKGDVGWRISWIKDSERIYIFLKNMSVVVSNQKSMWKEMWNISLGGGLTYYLIFNPSWGWHIFQMGWNQQLMVIDHVVVYFVLMLFHGKGWSLALWFVASLSLTDGFPENVGKLQVRNIQTSSWLQVKHVILKITYCWWKKSQTTTWRFKRCFFYPSIYS